MKSLVLFLFSLLFIGQSSFAERPSKGFFDGMPLFYAISGAVSLGSYQAGYSDYGLAWGKLNNMLNVNTITGTSAGSINSLLSIVRTCGSEPAKQQDSLFWKGWIPVGINNLFEKDKVTSLNLFSRRFEKEIRKDILSHWKKGLNKHCDIVLLVNLTRLNPQYIPFKHGLTIPRFTETFKVRIKGQGPGKLPLLSNYSQGKRGRVLALPFKKGDTEGNVKLLIDLVVSSASIPFAFNPLEIPFCELINSDKVGCQLKQAVKGEKFVDGSFFENTPLRQTYTLFKERMRNLQRKDVIFGLVDPQIKAFPIKREEHKDLTTLSTTRILETFVGNFIKSARVKELDTLLTEYPDINNRLLHSENYYPLIGDQLNFFYGFFERDFRIFDFLMGMYDSKMNLKLWMAKTSPKKVLYPDEDYPGRWMLQSCNDFFIHNLKEKKENCQKVLGSSFENIAILYQVSLNRLFSHCSELKDINTSHVMCKKAQLGGMPPQLLRDFKQSTWKKLKDETEFAYIMRLLGEYKFHFKDLGLAKNESEKGRDHIEDKLAEILDRFAEAQPKLKDKILIKFLKYLIIFNL